MFSGLLKISANLIGINHTSIIVNYIFCSLCCPSTLDWTKGIRLSFGGLCQCIVENNFRAVFTTAFLWILKEDYMLNICRISIKSIFVVCFKILKNKAYIIFEILFFLLWDCFKGTSWPDFGFVFLTSDKSIFITWIGVKSLALRIPKLLCIIGLKGVTAGDSYFGVISCE